MKQARTSKTLGLFHQFHWLRTCPPYLHGTEDESQTVKSGINHFVSRTSFYNYIDTHRVTIRRFPLPMIQTFYRLTIVTGLLWSSKGLTCRVSPRNAVFNITRYTNIPTNLVVLVWGLLWSVASNCFFSLSTRTFHIYAILEPTALHYFFDNTRGILFSRLSAPKNQETLKYYTLSVSILHTNDAFRI